MTDQNPAPGRSNPFWEFSLRIYSSPVVQKACVELQDGSGVDVNVMLYQLWNAANGRTMSDGDTAAVLAAIEPWRIDVVVPLRTARRNLKSPPQALDADGAASLRSIVKKAELEAERLQQQALYNLRLPPPSSAGEAKGRREIAVANLASYARALGRPLAREPIGDIVDAFEALKDAP